MTHGIFLMLAAFAIPMGVYSVRRCWRINLMLQREAADSERAIDLAVWINGRCS